MQEKENLFMNFSKKLDKVGANLSHFQAMIFERSVEKGVSSKMFIKCFMLSEEARLLDNLSLEIAGLTEIEIFDSICKKIKTKHCQLMPYLVIHFIGYFYRAAVYLSGYSSKQIYEMIPISFLERNYLVLHTFAIEEAVREVFEILKIEENDIYKRFKSIYTSI